MCEGVYGPVRVLLSLLPIVWRGDKVESSYALMGIIRKCSSIPYFL